MSYKHVVLTADWSVFGCSGSDSCSFIGCACFGLSVYIEMRRLYDNDTLGRNDIKGGRYFQIFLTGQTNRIKDVTKYFLSNVVSFSSLTPTAVFQH